jgi:Bacterial PH domain
MADDPPGAVLLAVATLVLASAGLFGTVARPRLAVDSTGATVRGLTGRRHWSWAEVNVRLARTRRLGRELSTIEVDAEHTEPPVLVVLGWLDLGTDPEDVIEAIRAIRT